MKSKYALLIVLASLFSCDSEDVKKRGLEAQDEVPADVVPSKPCTTLYKSIMDMFVEFDNNQDKYPALFASTTQKNIVLTKESDVFVTFISEGAGFENSLGYYTYNADSKPGKSSKLDLHILFPHVSDAVLTEGAMVQAGLGKFPKGTVIGFFLVLHGWQNGYVDLDKPIHYTDIDYNPGSHQQHILFKEGTCGDIVMAFEDKSLDQGSDYDFNDIIFTVSDNNEQLETVSFDLNNVVQYGSIDENTD